MSCPGTCATAGADNEPYLEDRKVDSAGLRIASDRRYEHDSCAHDNRAESPSMNATKHCRLPTPGDLAPRTTVLARPVDVTDRARDRRGVPPRFLD